LGTAPAKEDEIPTGRWKQTKVSSQTKSGPPLTMKVILACLPAGESTCLVCDDVVKGKTGITQPATGTRASGASELSNDGRVWLEIERGPMGYGRVRECIWAANNNRPCLARGSSPSIHSSPFAPIGTGAFLECPLVNQPRLPVCRDRPSAASRTLKIACAATVSDSPAHDRCRHVRS